MAESNSERNLVNRLTPAKLMPKTRVARFFQLAV